MPPRPRKPPVSEEYAKIGARIRRTRRRLALTQTDLAKMFGVGWQTISYMECGLNNYGKGRFAARMKFEQIRIWAEMNKSQPRKRFNASKRRVYKLPETLDRQRKKKEEKRRGKDISRSPISRRDQGNSDAGNRETPERRLDASE